MYILENSIIDIPQEPELEAQIIKCFKGEDDLIIFGCAEFAADEIRYFDDLKYNKGFDISYDIESINHPWGFESHTMTSYEMWTSWPTGRKIKEVKWYSADTEESLVTIIKSERITYKCRIVDKYKEPIDYKFELYMFEHHIISEEDDTEYRSLIIEMKDINALTLEVQSKLNSIIMKHI